MDGKGDLSENKANGGEERQPIYINNSLTVSQKSTLKTILFTLLVTLTIVLGGIAAYRYLTINEIPGGIIAQQIIEKFEITSIQWDYTDVIVIKEEQEWKLFGLIDIDPGEMILVAQYDGRMKLGIDAKELIIKEKINGLDEKKTLMLTLPPVKILSHEKIGPVNFIFQYGKFTREKVSAERFDADFEKRKAVNEKRAESLDLTKMAAESAKKQIQTLLMSIPDLEKNYVIEWID